METSNASVTPAMSSASHASPVPSNDGSMAKPITTMTAIGTRRLVGGSGPHSGLPWSCPVGMGRRYAGSGPSTTGWRPQVSQTTKTM